MRRFTFSNSVGAPVAGLALVLATAPRPAAAQCAMCNTAAGASDVGRGLSVSVLFLLGILATLAFGLVLSVVRTSRRDAGAMGNPTGPSGPDAP